MVEASTKRNENGAWVVVLDGVELAKTFGCQASALGYALALKAGVEGPQTWPCIMALGSGQQCARMLYEEYR